MNNTYELFELVGSLCRRRYKAGEETFSALGLNHTEARLLRLLDRAGGSEGQDVLSSGLYIDRSNVGRGLNKLADKGFVVRTKSQSDKRSMNVKLTAKGRQTVTKLSKARSQMVEDFFGSLSEKDAGTIVGILQKAFEGEAL